MIPDYLRDELDDETEFDDDELDDDEFDEDDEDWDEDEDDRNADELDDWEGEGWCCGCECAPCVEHSKCCSCHTTGRPDEKAERPNI